VSNQELSKKKILRAIELSAMDAEWLGMAERREALMLLRELTRSVSAAPVESASTASFNAAINFAIDDVGPEGLTFLRLWREGDWDAIRKEFPEFGLPLADAVPTP
jgi:hypothetical protein